jgi:hypothetical protein
MAFFKNTGDWFIFKKMLLKNRKKIEKDIICQPYKDEILYAPRPVEAYEYSIGI